MLESDWGIISSYNNPRDFYVQFERDLSDIEQVTEKVDEFARRETSKHDLKRSKLYVNDFVVAKWDEDGSWYRAVINETFESTNTSKVTFIDFGNSVTVSNNDILSESSEQLFETKPIAYRCTYHAPERTTMSHWEPLLNKFKAELSDDSRRFFIQVVGFSVSQIQVKLFTSAEDLKRDHDLLKEVQPDSSVKSTKNEDLQVAKSTYPPHPPLNETEVGMVVFVKNVDEFYVQISRDEVDLNAAYSELALIQSNLSTNQRFSSQISSDQPCVVLYSEDSCLYRGQLLRRSSNTLSVKLVDFGEVVEVPPTCIFPSAPSLMKYPNFGLHCKVNVESPSKREAVYRILQQLVESSSNIRIKFLTKTVPHNVILTGVGSSQVIAGDEEASNFSGGQLAPQSYSEGSTNVALGLPKRPHLSSGSRFHGSVVYETIETDDLMFLQTESDEKESNNIQSVLESFESLESLDRNALKVGMPCIAPYEDVLYRAVINSVGNQTLNVYFVDFGNTESLPLDSDVFKMPSKLSAFPPLCMRCRLVERQSVSDLPVDDGGDFVAADFEVAGGNENLWLIKYIDGKSSPVKTQVTGYPTPKHFVGERFTCSFTVVSSKQGEPSFCQLEATGDKLEEISDAIDSHASKKEPLTSSLARIGSACIAAHEDDNEFYRAEITREMGSSVAIKFVDFGNTRTLPISELFAPPSSITSIPSLAVPILLTQTQANSVEVETVIYNSEIIGGDCVSGWKVRILEIDPKGNGIDVSPKATENVLNAPGTFTDMNISPGDHLIGYYSYASDTIDELSYFQTPQMATLLEDISESIEALTDSLASLPASLAISDQSCLAQDVDEVFYRARITKRINENVSVLFVDYGTSRTIPADSLKQMPSSLLKTPICVIPLRLDEHQLSGIDLEREDYDLEIFDGDTTNGFRVIVDGVAPAGNINELNQKVSDDQLANGCQKSIEAATICHYASGSQTIGTKLSGYFIYVSEKEDKHSYFQTHDMADRLNEEVMPLLNQAEKLTDLQSACVQVGQACVAKDVDDIYYRASIIQRLGNDVQILFVDYGTSLNVPSDQLKRPSVELLSLPICIVPLILSDKQMTGIDLDREDYEIELLEGDESSGWRVSIDGLIPDDFTNISVSKGSGFPQNMRSEPSASVQAVNDSALFPQPCIKSVKSMGFARRSHVIGNQLTGFFTYLPAHDREPSYFQTNDMLNSANKITEELSELVTKCAPMGAEEVRVGQACLAQDVDEVFYRALIKEVENSEYQVVFVDFGTSRTLSIAEMKHIPENLLSVPMNVTPLILTSEQKASIDLDHEDYEVTLITGDESTGWGVVIDGVDLDDSSPKKPDIPSEDTHSTEISVQIDGSPVRATDSLPSGRASTHESPSKSPQSDTVSPHRYGRGLTKVGDSYSGYFTFLSHSEGVMSYFQSNEMLENATIIGEQLSDLLETCEDLPASEAQVGLPCVAQDVDEVYYRAVITKKSVDKSLECLFVDYGTFGNPTAPLKRIPEELRLKSMSVIPLRLTCEEMLPLDVNSENVIQIVGGDEVSGWFVSINKVDVLSSNDHTTAALSPTSVKSNDDPISLIDRYPERGEKQGDSLKCIALMVATSPENLSYIQTQTDEAMTRVIDSTLADHRSTSEVLSSSKIAVGQACLALHEEDGLYYRALITDVKDKCVSVKFVDWGNFRHDLELSSLRPVPSRLLEIPALAIPTKLTSEQIEIMDLDIVYMVNFENGSFEEGWTIDFKAIENEISTDTETVVPQASSSPPSKSPASSSLHVSPIAQNTEIADFYPCREEVSTNFVAMSADKRNVHGGYLVSGTIISRPSSCPSGGDGDSPQLVYFRLTADEHRLKDIDDRLHSIVSSEHDGWRLPQLPMSMCVPKGACLVHDAVNLKWYRGQLINVDTSNNTSEVQLVDYGDQRLYLVPLTQLHRLPKWLRGVPPLCLTCHPRDRESWEVVQANQHVLMRLVGVDSSTGVVTATFCPLTKYDREQLLQIKDRVLSSEVLGAQEVSRPILPPSDTIDPMTGTVEVNVTDVTEHGFLQVSLVSEQVESTKFCESVDATYQIITDCLIPVKQPIVNGAYVCRDAHGRFSRVRTVSLFPTDNTCVLHFIDLGYTKTLSNVHFYFLLPHMCHDVPRTWLCNFLDKPLTNALSQAERAQVRTILTSHPHPFRICFEADDADKQMESCIWWRPHKVTFPVECMSEVAAETLQRVRSILNANIASDIDVIDISHRDLYSLRLPTRKIASSQKMEMRVTWAESPGAFWCRDVSTEKSIERIQSSLLASLGATSNPIYPANESVDIVIGGFYALVSSWGWRRVVLLDWPSDQVVIVQCVDDGMRAEADPQSLRYIPSQCAASEIPCLAIRCSLYGVMSPAGGSVWSEDICDRFCAEAKIGTWAASVERVVRATRGHEMEAVLYVSLVRSDDGISLAQILLRENLALSNISSPRNTSVSSYTSINNGVEVEDNSSSILSEEDDEMEVCCFIDGELNQMSLPRRVTLPIDSVEVVITRVDSCSDFWIAPAQGHSVLQMDMNDLEELPRKVEPVMNLPSNISSIWCSMFRANRLCRVLVTLPAMKSSDQEPHYKLKFVDEGICEEVREEAFLGGLHEMPISDWLTLPRLAVRCSLYNSSGQDSTPLIKRMHDRRQLTAFVTTGPEDGHYTVALLDRVDGVDCAEAVSYCRDLCKREAQSSGGFYFVPCESVVSEGETEHDRTKNSISGMLFADEILNVCRSINAKLVTEGVATFRSE